MWALSNLCRGKNPPPDFTKVICQDKYVAMATANLSHCLSISFLTFTVKSLIELLACFNRNKNHVKANTRTFSFFPLQVSPCLSVLSWLLFVNDTDILADACWALSYLSDGPNDKIQAVIDSGVCRRLVELLM